MRKGFLLIDGYMNTVIVSNPYDDEELSLPVLFDDLKKRKLLDTVKIHDTRKGLMADVKAYIDGTYEENKPDM